MKVLVIPDVHLKPEMFKNASEILKNGFADRAVCLMDIADDWNQSCNIDLYIETYDEAIFFAKKHPGTLWCYGNHDLSYLWDEYETGFSTLAQSIVCEKMNKLIMTVEDNIAYINRIDNYLFMHGGLTEAFVRKYVIPEEDDDIEKVLSKINSLGRNEMWQDTSPIWYRPQYCKDKMYGKDKYIQVVGHTPVDAIYQINGVISCDVFSTYSDGKPIGTQEYLVIDTETGEYHGIC